MYLTAFYQYIIACLKQVIPNIKSEMNIINLIHAAAGKPITGSFKHICTSNTSQWEILKRNMAFELINLHVADRFFLIKL